LKSRCLGQKSLRAFDKRRTGLGRLDRPAGAPDQHGVDFGFEGTNSLRRRRRRDVKAARGFGDRMVIDRH